MELELPWYTFQDPRLLDQIYGIDAATNDNVDKVLEKVLLKFDLQNPEWGAGNAKEPRRRWDLDEKSGRKWCEPLVWFQNHVVDSIRDIVGWDPACVFGDLNFRVWGRPLKEGLLLGGTGLLKPPIIHHRTLQVPEEGLSWRDVLLVEEVTEDLQAGILQLSIYTQYLFVAHEERFYIPSLIFECHEAAFYLLLYTRSEIIATPPMFLRTDKGLREIVKMFICLMRWTSEKALINASRSQNWLCLEGLGHKFRIHETIYRRTDLIGPSTRVHILVKDTKEMVGNLESEEAEPGKNAELGREEPRIRAWRNRVQINSGKIYRFVGAPRRSTRLTIKSHAEQRVPHSFPVTVSGGSTRLATEQEIPIIEATMSKLQLTPASDWEALKPGKWSLIPRVDHEAELYYLHIPDLSENNKPRELVYKLSTSLAARYGEGEMFIPFHDESDVPNIIAGLEAKTQEGEVIETTAFCSSKAKFWNVLLSAKEKKHQSDSIFLNRRLYALLMSTVGRPLAAAPTIIHLLEGVLHAMLGHYVLYRSGWLHRDVSTSNVLLLKNPEPRKQETIKEVLEPEIKLGDCRGMIVDGDHAVKWKEAREDRGRIRSDTLPFLSIRLLDTLWDKNPSLHTAIDDLESFFWVLVVSIFECRHIRGISERFTDHMYRELHVPDFSRLQYMKVTVIMALEERDLSTIVAFASVIGLLEEWFELSRSYAKQLGALAAKGAVDDYDVLCKKAYKAYFKAGFRKLEELKADPTKHNEW